MQLASGGQLTNNTRVLARSIFGLLSVVSQATIVF